MPVKILSILLLLLCFAGAQAQTCTAPGQNPGTAFPVCGTNTFVQQNVPICGTHTMIVPCNDGAQYEDKNPFWYKFTCFTAGNLVFKITPHSLSDDYDWQLFDITGRNPDDVFTDPTLFVCCNWSGASGITGTNLTATNNTACAGGTPIFSKAPTLIVSHEYLLMISHFSGGSQSGYDLSFGGGTASITDTTPPKLSSVFPSCDGKQLTVKLNKKMKCSSLAANGSDFGFSPTVPVVFTSVSGIGCSTGFDTDSIILTLQNPIPVGNYQLLAQNGTDANTILDYCGNSVSNQVPLVIALNQPTPFDSLAPVGCAPQTLKVIFRKPVLCSSIASDVSDFTIAGTQPVSITSIAGACNSNGETSSITLTLSRRLQVAGTYGLTLRRGTDGNTLLDICNQETPENSVINFTVKDTVSAAFTYTVFLDCKLDSIAYLHQGGNSINSWNWVFDGGGSSIRSILPNPVIRYPVFGVKTAKLTVSNGICNDSATVSINLDNFLKAGFGGPEVLCPKDSAVFTDSSQGKIRFWQWRFGNGATSVQKQPPIQVYPPTNLQATYPVTLVIEDSIGCRDSLTKKVIVVNNCYIDVPTAFTPNGDGLNDYLYPLNAFKADKLEFKVFNRFGQLVWQTTDWTRKWDGRVNGTVGDTGAYVWFLTYTHKETGKKVQLQGTTVLIR